MINTLHLGGFMEFLLSLLVIAGIVAFSAHLVKSKNNSKKGRGDAPQVPVDPVPVKPEPDVRITSDDGKKKKDTKKKSTKTAKPKATRKAKK